MDTDTELLTLLAKLRQLADTMAALAEQQAALKAEFDKTQVRADELRRKANDRPSN